MKTYQKIATWAGIVLSLIAVALMFTIHWIMGVFATALVIFAYFWWKKMKTTGDKYMKELAEKTGLTFKSGGLAYGNVYGLYKGYDVSISVTSDYNSDSGLLGFTMSRMFMNSAIGVVEGIENYTIVKLKHGKMVREPYSVDKRTFVDTHAVVYFPPVAGVDGLPGQAVAGLIRQLDRLVAIANKL